MILFCVTLMTLLSLLPQDRYSAARSCVPWSLVIGLTSVWGELTIRDTTLTR